MSLSCRSLLAALAALTMTCAHKPAGQDRGSGVRAEDLADDLARPDGELASERASASAPAAEASDESESTYRDTIVQDAEPMSKVEGTHSAPSRRSPPPAPARPALPPPAPSGEGRRTSKPTSSFISERATGARDDDTRSIDAKLADALRGPSAAEPTTAKPAARTREEPVAPALKAGRHDDNKEYNRFLAFLDQYRRFAVYSTDISERLLVRALDQGGHTLPNCPVAFKSTSGKVLSETTTYADGSTQFFPAADSGPNDSDYLVDVRCGKTTRTGQLIRKGRRTHEVHFDFARKVPQAVPVDVAIVLDTTGSMQNQIDRLKQTLKAIHYQLTSLPTHPDIRFGMVAYRDRGDDYVTQVTPFSSDVESYQEMLQQLVASGGGDRPEDLQAALEAAMHQLKWRPEALRVGFVITDAPPHTDYRETYNYLAAMKESLGRGIKWVTVGAGGLDISGEVIYRQIAQYTMGEYVFLTQSGGDDSGGDVGEASHHVGANYQTENLDQAIVRIVRRELSYLTNTPKDFDTTIVATKDKTTPREQILVPAVAEALRQLADYSALRLDKKTLVAIVPVTAEAKHKPMAEYLTDQLILSASRTEAFKVVERNLAAVTQEMRLQLSNLFDESATVPIGKMVGAEVLIAGKLVVDEGGGELFAKLVRVATGEVLSVASVRVTGDPGFGTAKPSK